MFLFHLVFRAGHHCRCDRTKFNVILFCLVSTEIIIQGFSVKTIFLSIKRQCDIFIRCQCEVFPFQWCGVSLRTGIQHKHGSQRQQYFFHISLLNKIMTRLLYMTNKSGYQQNSRHILISARGKRILLKLFIDFLICINYYIYCIWYIFWSLFIWKHFLPYYCF